MGVSLHGLFFCFTLFGFLTTGSLAKTPELTISPSPSVQTKPVGRSVLLTCQPDVDNKNLITDLMWKDPQGRPIDINYVDRQWVTTEVMEEKALALIINSFQESQAGDYTCSAVYANTERLSKTVRLESIHPIVFEDAPEVQNPIVNRDYKIRCKVSANPAPHVDWSKNNELIKPSRHYVIATDGLLITNVTESDDGTYICRAVVIKTGELSARSIKVEVHTPPDFKQMNSTVELIEGETQSIECSATGKPKPTYSWIRKDNSANMARVSRFTVNEATGLMVIDPVHESDHGEYKCVASNAAANVERIIKLSVKVRPKISEIKNVSVPILRTVELECLARGRPLPEISFRKYGSPERMTLGPQLYDRNRIFVQNRKGANENEIIGVLRIQQITRNDDGLYECMASNSAGDSFKTGHITVEFPPSFANTPMNETISWDQRPVNLTCLAESIPNATIIWRLNDYDIDERDYNIRKFGNGPVSTLVVQPVAQKYYGAYKCVASNPHGRVNHTIFLKEAFRPTTPLQTDVDSMTATTIKFRIIGPQMDGNTPIRSYVVQYRDSRTDWMYAMNKTWTYNFPYVLENLQPSNTYHFRFAAMNDVGTGPWSADKTQTIPRQSSPAAPEILNARTNGDIIDSPYDTQIEVKWKIPADNGESIDMYQISYCEVYRKPSNFDEVNCPAPIDLDVARHRKTSYLITHLKPDTHYKVNVAAHNRLGLSRPGEAIFRTARGIDKDHLVATSQGLILSSGAIVGIVVASLLVILLIIDVSCFFVNRTGMFYLMCGRKRKSPPDEINKLASLTGWRFPLPYCSHTTTTSYTGSGAKHSGIDLEILPPPDSDLALYEEKEPLKENGRPKIEVMDDRLKKDTRILYDDKNSTVKTFIGKDSAV